MASKQGFTPRISNEHMLLRSKVVKNLVVDRFDPESKQRPTLSLVPQSSLSEFWLPLNYFDISPAGKNGCGGFEKYLVLFGQRNDGLDF